MRRTIDLTLSVTGLFALMSAAGCSAEPEGSGGGAPQMFGVAGTTGVVPGGGGASGGTGVNGGAGTTGAPGEGQGGTSFNAGTAGTTGVGTAGAGAVVDVAPQETPGGYFESGAWRGYGWTGDDALNIGTTRSVLDYSALPAGSPFCLEGTVGNDPQVNMMGGYRGVALLGFNISQEAFGPVEGQEAPVLETVPEQAGVAVNFTRNAPPAGQTVTPAPLLRIQLQDNAGGQWCANLTSVTGTDFIRYEQDPANPTAEFFRTNCWEAVGSPTSRPYAREPISAVVLTVPGDATADFYYNVCVAGFADGNSAADAPTSISLGAGVLTGTLVTEAAKTKVAVDGKSYIINNNAWGDNSGDGTQRLRYTNNSFEILQQSAGPGAESSPASFPSIYIGANGAQSGVNGFTTSENDNLPIQVSAITSIPTTFRHNATSGDYNATYDVWFAPNGTPGEYDTAQAAFLMVWTYKPTGRVAIGSRSGPITVDGRQWFLYVGPRGGGGPDSNLPVISYVNEGPSLQEYSFDLNVFIDDAVNRNIGLTNNMFLTDVFAGFEIWSGGAGLRLNEFTAVVNP